MMLKTVQAVSGLIFAAFLSVHLLNTWLAAFGPETYDAFQRAAQGVYQFAPLEILILGAGLVHAVVGLVRWVSEPKRQLSTRARWHRRSAVFLLVFIVGHVMAVRGPSWFADVYPRFEGLAFSIDFAPYYFYPYYFLLGVAGFYHGFNGIGIAVSRLFGRSHLSAATLKATTAFASVAMLIALLSLGGVFFDVGPVEESDFARLAFRVLAELSGA